MKNNLIVAFLLVFILASCYDNEEGCLDVRAANYSITSDVECTDCCTYPNMVVSISQFFNEEEFLLGDTLMTGTGQSFVFLDYIYILSDVQLLTPEGPVTVMDSLLLSGGDDVRIKKDLFKVQKGRFQNTVGSFIYEGPIDKLSLQMGLPSIVDDRKIASEDYFMNSVTDSLYNGEEYIIQRIKIAKGENLTDTVIYNVGQQYGRHLYDFTFEDAFSTRGDNLELRINADYGFWFRNIDFTQSQSEVEQLLFENSSDFLY